MATRAELKARLSLDSSLFVRGTKVAHEATAQLGSTFQRVGSTGLAMWGKLAGVIAAVGGAAGFVAATKHAYELGRELTDLSEQTGISVKSVVVLQEAFRHAGLESEDLGRSINRMQRYIVQGGVKKFGEDFLAIRDAAPEEQFMAIAKSISALPSAAQRAAAAMEIFGRGGGRLLSVFANVGEMSRIQQGIGRQAELLARNAEAFRRVTISLQEVGIRIRGFFVGVASGALSFVQPLLNQLNRLDFTVIGQRFGKALAQGAQAMVGFLSDKNLFFAGLQSALKAGFLELGNVLVAVFKMSITFFQDGMIQAFQSLGDILSAALLKGMAKPIAWFQAQIIGGALSMGKVMEALSPKFMLPWKRVQLLNQAGQFGAQEAEKAYQEIMATGGPKMGFTGGGQTADQLIARAKTELGQALSGAMEAMKKFSIQDVTGAGDEMKKAFQLLSVAIQKGAEVLQKGLEDVTHKIVYPTMDWWSRRGESPGMELLRLTSKKGPYGEGRDWVPGIGWQHSLAGAGGAEPWKMLQPSGGLTTGGLVGGSLAQAPGSWFASGLGQQGGPGSAPLFRRDTTLSHAEQAKIMNEMVAAGMPRPVAFPGAYNAVAAGDYQRRRRAEREVERREVRQALGLQTTSDLLHEISDNTRNTAQALQEEGQ